LDATVTSITVVIPLGVTDNSTIAISSPSVDTPVNIKFRNFGLIVQSYGDGLWGGTDVSDGSNPGDPKPLYGVDKFSRKNEELNAWDWSTLFGWGYNLNDEEIVTNPENYYFKCEINTNKPISVGDIIFEGAGAKQHHWNPATGGISFDTMRKWKTVTLELKDLEWAVEAGTWNNFAIIYQPSEAISADFSIANARIVHK
jgi:hypothetical protein